MAISFAGTDVRIESMAREQNPYFRQMSYSAGENKIRKRLNFISQYIPYAITDYELSEYVKSYFKKVYVLPQPIDLSKFDLSYPDPKNEIPAVFHVPTNKDFKGTKYIISAVDRLKTEGFNFEFRLQEPVFSQNQFYKEIAKADIVVDEILCGAYGMTSIESMACGKPTLTFIREDLLKKYPKELPIVNANPETIYNVLKKLFRSAELRHEIGKKSREYVEKYHSLSAVGPKLLEIYKEIGLKN